MPKREGLDTQHTDKIIELAKIGAKYLRIKREIKDKTAEAKKENTLIKEAIKNDGIEFTVNGKHKELYAPLGDGVNEIFFQIQTAESVSMVDNVLDLVKKKLGDKADNFIMTVEVLHDNALEAMLNQGLITEQDVLEWTTTKSTERLIVKSNKKK